MSKAKGDDNVQAHEHLEVEVIEFEMDDVVTSSCPVFDPCPYNTDSDS